MSYEEQEKLSRDRRETAVFPESTMRGLDGRFVTLAVSSPIFNGGYWYTGRLVWFEDGKIHLVDDKTHTSTWIHERDILAVRFVDSLWQDKIQVTADSMHR